MARRLALSFVLILTCEGSAYGTSMCSSALAAFAHFKSELQYYTPSNSSPEARRRKGFIISAAVLASLVYPQISNSLGWDASPQRTPDVYITPDTHSPGGWKLEFRNDEDQSAPTNNKPEEALAASSTIN